jgi:hypothetical protein
LRDQLRRQRIMKIGRAHPPIPGPARRRVKSFRARQP